MHATNFSAAITMQEADRTFYCNCTPVLTYSAEYPQAALPCNPTGQFCINRDICVQVRAFYCYVSNDLFRQAVEGCREACQNGYPFNGYDAVQHFEITYNQQCHFSLYRDQYTYTGGAHGGTVRSSDTWSLKTGCRLPLASFFPNKKDYRAFLIGQITCLADQQMQQNPGIYFENYRELIRKYFDEQSYYLTPDGLAIYYQQYEIAPYATGIVVFTIPYQTLKWQPGCGNADVPLGKRP
ncbi:MAG: DUF3298 and DUF4163 domain-containing protein [Christensenellales bacterium]